MKKLFLGILVGALALLSACSSCKETQEWIEVNAMVELDTRLDLSVFKNVKITGIDVNALTDSEMEVLYTQSRYCQAMVDADIDTMKEIVPADVTFTHMSGMKQTRYEYFEDIKNGALNYYNIGIENPKNVVRGSDAMITYTSVLDANAYGAKGVYKMSGIHRFKKIDGMWHSVN